MVGAFTMREVFWAGVDFSEGVGIQDLSSHISHGLYFDCLNRL